MDTTAIFQRTDRGRDTIKTKAVKLTQSERLLLIIIDGSTAYGVLRKEVWALSEDRFDRALQTLLREGLIFEVLLPVQDQPAEELEKDVIDLFLQQDPLDPVTIISFDPEDEFGSDDFSAPVVPVAVTHEIWPPPPPAVPEVPSPAAGSAVAAAESSYSPPLPDELPKLSSSVPVQPLNELMDEDEDLTPSSLFQTPAKTPEPAVPVASVDQADELPENWPEHLFQNPASPPHRPTQVERVHWVYWVALVSGIAMLLVSLFSRNMH